MDYTFGVDLDDANLRCSVVGERHQQAELAELAEKSKLPSRQLQTLRAAASVKH